MRIGIITGEYPPMQGGVGDVCHILAEQFTNQEQAVFVLSHATTTEANERIHLANTVQRWGMGSLNTVRQWAKTNQLDVVNLHFQTAAYGMSPFVHFIPHCTSVPIVTTFHDLRFPYLFPKAGKLRNWIVMHLARQSSGVIVTNHEDYERVAELDRARLIPIGGTVVAQLPENYEREAWREGCGVRDGELLLAHFGFINHSKGLDTLLDTLAIVRQQGLAFRLVMIGGRTGSSDPTNAAYAQQIDRQIERLGLQDVIHWTGFVSDAEVYAYLQAADLVVLPFRDGASYRRSSLLTALRNRCAIITTEPIIHVPTFVHGENLWIVPRENVNKLTKAILTLAESPQLQAQLRQGAEKLNQHFNWTSIAQETMSFFEEVSAQTRRKS